jgi:A/G-specific adenine glycosylase
MEIRSVHVMFLATHEFSRRLLRWYRIHRRDLPWRVPTGAPDSYLVLVSEAMLQQTQVASVIPYFHRFIKRFPTLRALAESKEEEVLRLWQGLGYYSRARNLRGCAIAVMDECAGQLPCEPRELLKLPGIGRYTAGAIASIAFNKRAPILDGNVSRVLCRLDKITADPREKTTNELLWMRAAEIMPVKGGMGDFNSALMELGATVCTPRNPKCLICPVRQHCEGCSAGLQESIPLRKKSKPTPLHKRWIFCIHRDGRFLIEQRPAKGRWAGMWQFVTRGSDDVHGLPVRVGTPERLTVLQHALTHRRYEFVATLCDAVGANGSNVWVTLEELDHYPMPRPHVLLAEMLSKRLIAQSR